MANLFHAKPESNEQKKYCPRSQMFGSNSIDRYDPRYIIFTHKTLPSIDRDATKKPQPLE